MFKDRSKDSPERTQTDDGLRTERENTDHALTDRRAAVNEAADRVVERARDQADAVLQDARDKADQRRDRQPTAVAMIHDERAAEDAAVRDERAAADEALRLERQESGRILAALLPFERDATDRYLLSERIRSDDAVANRDNFLGIVSHDLRDLLGGVVMAAGLIAKRAPDGDAGAPTREGVERIQRYAARMKRLIGDLVDVASIDEGRVAVAPVRGDLSHVIKEAADSFRAASAAAHLSLTADVKEPLFASFDYERMLQVLANLITNAIKFTPQGGSIRIHGERVGTDIRVSVSDTGPGIPEEFLEAVFERFRQVAEHDRRGLGLGLYLSRYLVKAHGGRMWAESISGQGTTVRFTLPSPDDRRKQNA